MFEQANSSGGTQGAEASAGNSDSMQQTTAGQGAVGAGASTASLASAGSATTAPALRDRYRDAARAIADGKPLEEARSAFTGTPAAGGKAGGSASSAAGGEADGQGAGAHGSEDAGGEGGSASAAASAGQDALEAAALGLSDKELAQLKRSPLHVSALKMIPPSNRKALAQQFLADAQQLAAEKDRLYQAQKGAGKGKAGEEAGDKDAGEDAGAQTATDGHASTQTQTQTEAPSNAGTPLEALDGFKQAFTISDETYRTLTDALGEDYAKAERASREAAVRQLEGAFTPLVQAVNFLSGVYAEQMFDRELEGMVKQSPVYADVITDPAKRAALRAETDAFVRASGEMDLAKAVRRAAASLFSVDIQQATLARAATSRQQTVRGGIHPTSGEASTRKPLSGRERYAAVAEYMAKHPTATAEEVRAAVDAT
jgi:hypothetical protein